MDSLTKQMNANAGTALLFLFFFSSGGRVVVHMRFSDSNLDVYHVGASDKTNAFYSDKNFYSIIHLIPKQAPRKVK